MRLVNSINLFGFLNQETVTQEKCPIPQNRRQQRIKPGPSARAPGANLTDRGSCFHKPVRVPSSENFIKPHHFLAPPPPPPPPQAVHLSEGSGRPKAAAPYPLLLLAPCGANTSQNRGMLAILEKSGALNGFADLTWFLMGFVLHSSHRCVLLLQTRLAQKIIKGSHVHGDEFKNFVTWQVLSDQLSTGCYTALRPRCLRCMSRRQSLRPYAPLTPMDGSVWER
jgi:hypothetical protein